MIKLIKTLVFVFVGLPVMLWLFAMAVMILTAVVVGNM